jgi:hypothetical protein
MHYFRKNFFLLLLIPLLPSCIVQAPKYTSVEQVFTLKTMMTKEEVNTALGVTPYDVKSVSDSQTVFIYKYRTTDRKTLPLFLGKTNGKSTPGKYVDLQVTFNKAGLVKSYETVPEPVVPREKNSIDINSLFTLLTVTAPAVLVYLGLRNK